MARRHGEVKDDDWMEKAFGNSHGQFSEKAKKAKMSTHAFAEKEKGAGGKTGHQANLALMGMKYGGGVRRKKKKEA